MGESRYIKMQYETQRISWNDPLNCVDLGFTSFKSRSASLRFTEKLRIQKNIYIYMVVYSSDSGLT